MNGRNVFGSKITLKVVWWVLKRIVASPPKTPVNCRQVKKPRTISTLLRPTGICPATTTAGRFDPVPSASTPPPADGWWGGGVKAAHSAHGHPTSRRFGSVFSTGSANGWGANGRGPSRTRRTHAAAILLQRRQLTGHVVSHVVYVVRPDVSGADQHVRFAQQRREAVHVGVGDATVPAAFVAHAVHDLRAQGPAKAVTGFARRRAQQHDVITVVVEYPIRLTVETDSSFRYRPAQRLYERAAETGAKTRVCLRRGTANRWTYGDVRCDQWTNADNE